MGGAGTQNTDTAADTQARRETTLDSIGFLFERGVCKLELLFAAVLLEGVCVSVVQRVDGQGMGGSVCLRACVLVGRLSCSGGSERLTNLKVFVPQCLEGNTNTVV